MNAPGIPYCRLGEEEAPGCTYDAFKVGKTNGTSLPSGGILDRR